MTEQFMLEAIRLSEQMILKGNGGPFGAVVVKEGSMVGKGYNQVPDLCDPTAHAEIVAIRDACKQLGVYALDGCVLYTSCEPCPMCLAAIYWARIDKVYYANLGADAKAIGFDDVFIHEELVKPPAQRALKMENLMRDEALEVFRKWEAKPDKVLY